MNVAIWVLLILKRNEQFSHRSPNLTIRPEMSLLLSIFVHVCFFSFRFFRRTTKKKQKIFSLFTIENIHSQIERIIGWFNNTV